MDTLATRLRAALEARGMTPPDLIRATGLSRATVYFMLDGTTAAPNVRASTVGKLCKALGVSREYLFDGRGALSDVTGAAFPSESVRLDPGIVMTVAEAMRIWLSRRGKSVDLTDAAQADLFALAYAELSAMRAASPSQSAAGAVVADLMAAREAGIEQVGSGAAGGFPRQDQRKPRAGNR